MSGNAVQSAGTRLYIATGTGATGIPADAAAWAALTWTEVEEIEDIGSFGESYEKVTYKALSSGSLRKKKGTVDHGSTTLKLARIPTAAGQTAVKAAVDDRKNAYCTKITFDDAPASGQPTTIYFPAYYMSYTTEIGGNDKVIESSVGLEIDGKPLEVAAHVGA